MSFNQEHCLVKGLSVLCGFSFVFFVVIKTPEMIAPVQPQGTQRKTHKGHKEGVQT